MAARMPSAVDWVSARGAAVVGTEVLTSLKRISSNAGHAGRGFTHASRRAVKAPDPAHRDGNRREAIETACPSRAQGLTGMVAKTGAADTEALRVSTGRLSVPERAEGTDSQETRSSGDDRRPPVSEWGRP